MIRPGNQPPDYWIVGTPRKCQKLRSIRNVHHEVVRMASIRPTIQKIKGNTIRFVVATRRFVLRWVAILSVGVVILAGLYFISEPFAKFGNWYAANNILPRALLLVLAPIAATIASQIKQNLVDQRKRGESKSVRQAFREIDGQVVEAVMEWIKWMAFGVGALALAQIVDRL